MTAEAVKTTVRYHLPEGQVVSPTRGGGVIRAHYVIWEAEMFRSRDGRVLARRWVSAREKPDSHDYYLLDERELPDWAPAPPPGWDALLSSPIGESE